MTFPWPNSPTADTFISQAESGTPVPVGPGSPEQFSGARCFYCWMFCCPLSSLSQDWVGSAYPQKGSLRGHIVVMLGSEISGAIPVPQPDPPWADTLAVHQCNVCYAVLFRSPVVAYDITTVYFLTFIRFYLVSCWDLFFQDLLSSLMHGLFVLLYLVAVL